MSFEELKSGMRDLQDVQNAVQNGKVLYHKHAVLVLVWDDRVMTMVSMAYKVDVPGGRAHKGEDLRWTAIREALEEVSDHTCHNKIAASKVSEVEALFRSKKLPRATLVDGKKTGYYLVDVSSLKGKDFDTIGIPCPRRNGDGQTCAWTTSTSQEARAGVWYRLKYLKDDTTVQHLPGVTAPSKATASERAVISTCSGKGLQLRFHNSAVPRAVRARF